MQSCSSESGTPTSTEQPTYVVLDSSAIEPEFKELEEQLEQEPDREMILRHAIDCIQQDKLAEIELDNFVEGYLERIPQELNLELSLEMRCFQLVGLILRELMHLHGLYRRGFLNYALFDFGQGRLVLIRQDVLRRRIRDELSGSSHR